MTVVECSWTTWTAIIARLSALVIENIMLNKIIKRELPLFLKCCSEDIFTIFPYFLFVQHWCVLVEAVKRGDAYCFHRLMVNVFLNNNRIHSAENSVARGWAPIRKLEHNDLTFL